MKRVYMDNAATTKLDPQVLEAMMPYLTDNFGNPSSTHSFGRVNKSGIETARRSIAKHLNCKPAEIVFTSGGTEADNMAIVGAVNDLGVTHLITSAVEHHAVGHTVENICESKGVRMSIVRLDECGRVDMEHLESLLQEEGKAMVSLMHANNEIGTLLPLKQVGELCEKYGAFFHSDTVQTMGHYPFDLQEIKAHFITCAAHKFHGPKGVGFLFKRDGIHVTPLIHGGAQERQARGGTENLYGIVGLGKAMDLAHEHMAEHQQEIQAVKTYMKAELKNLFPDVHINGVEEEDGSLYTVLNVCLPKFDKQSMLLFSLDLKGVACSGGSACSSGSTKASHVLTAIDANLERPNVRFSFGRFSTKEDVDHAIGALREIYMPVTA